MYVCTGCGSYPAISPETSRPDGAESASGAEGGASINELKEEERIDTKAMIVAPIEAS